MTASPNNRVVAKTVLAAGILGTLVIGQAIARNSFLDSFSGGAAGAALGNLLTRPPPPQPPQPQYYPQQQLQPQQYVPRPRPAPAPVQRTVARPTQQPKQENPKPIPEPSANIAPSRPLVSQREIPAELTPSATSVSIPIMKSATTNLITAPKLDWQAGQADGSVTGPTQDQIVTVTGTGDTVSEARNDAIRQALQATMRQLVIAERIVKNDELVLDKIMSTMNGYIESFDEIRSYRKDQQVFIEAKVKVSASRIENFASDSTKNGTYVGSALGAEVQRMRAEFQARGEIFDHMFRGFPTDDIEVIVKKVSVDPDDPDVLHIDALMRFAPAFVANLRASMAAIARDKYTVPYDWKSVQGSNAGFILPTSDAISYPNGIPYNLNFARQSAQPTIDNISSSVNADDMRICIYGQTIDCFVLPKANYGSSFWHSEGQLGIGSVVFFLRFLNDAGQSVGNPCVMVKPTDVTDAPEYLTVATKRNIGPAVMPAILDIRKNAQTTTEIFDFPRYLRATVAISAVANDLTSVKRIALFAADAAPFNGEPHLVTDILKGPSDATACGEKMDEISELAMVSK